MDIEATLGNMHEMMASIQAERDQAAAGSTHYQATIDDYERKLKPMRKVWRFLAALASIAVLIFGVGVSYQQFMGGNATKSDIDNGMKKHEDAGAHPEATEAIERIQADIEPIKAGVESLVVAQEAEHEFKTLQRRLTRHDKEYQEAFQEYTADKAAGKRAGTRPRKTEAHLNLEARVKEAEDKL